MFRTQLIRAETKVLDLKAGQVSAIVSTEVRDRAGDIIRQAGWDLTNFLKHPVLVSSHNYLDLRNQIGEWEELAVVGKKLTGIARYYIGEGNAQADWGFNLASKGRAAFSVGFRPDMAKAKQLDDGDDPFRINYEFNGQELLEVSQVILPANAAALQTLKSFQPPLPLPLTSIIEELLKEAPTELEIYEHLPLLMSIFAKPFPNEHSCRLREPGDFKPESFRRTEREHEGKKYSVIMGRLKGEETMTEQAYRYPKGNWNTSEARSHCKSHDGAFEAASEEEKLNIKAMTEGMSEHAEDCPECQKAIKEHMKEGKRINLSQVVQQAIESALKEA